MAAPTQTKSDPQTAPETREIATTQDGRDITLGYVDALRLLLPTDSILRMRAQDHRLCGRSRFATFPQQV